MTNVKLSCGDIEQEFSIDHAEKLLSYEAQLGLSNWALTDEKFKLEDGFIKTKDSRADKKSKEQKLDNEGDIPSE
jgi:hypothetical protein